jgi:hypothetical protein
VLVAVALDATGACPPLVPRGATVEIAGAMLSGAEVTGAAGTASTGGTGMPEIPATPAIPANPANPAPNAAGIANGSRKGAACTNGQNRTTV